MPEMIASFENTTDEPLLDGTLEAAMAGAIANASGLHVAPRERVVDTLRLMGLSPDTPLDRSRVREVALRDGGVAAAVVGGVRELEGEYLVSIEVLDVETGLIRASLSELVATQSELIEAISRLAGRVRASLLESADETLPNSRRGGLRRVSTTSLEALQLYSQADAALRSRFTSAGRDDLNLAELQLREAIAVDPHFASAHLLLALALSSNGEAPSTYRSHLDRALELADGLPARESLFVRAVRAGLGGETEEAIALYRLLLRAHPDHWWGQTRLAELLKRTGRHREALVPRRALARMRPNDFGLHWQLAIEETWIEGLESALPSVRHALAIAPPEDGLRPGEQWAITWLEGALPWEPWLAGNVEAFAREADRLDGEIPLEPPGERRQNLIWLALTMDGALGRLERAQRWADLGRDDLERAYLRLAVALLAEQPERLDAALASYLEIQPSERPINSLVPELLARRGQVERAERLSERRRDRSPLLDGHLALARGEAEEAIAAFEAGLATHRTRNARYFLAVAGLAEAYRLKGDHARARLVLEEASAQRSQTVATFSGAHWLAHQARLAGLYRDLGLTALADEVEVELAHLLRFSDSDHPLRIRLDSRDGHPLG